MTSKGSKKKINDLTYYKYQKKGLYIKFPSIKFIGNKIMIKQFHLSIKFENIKFEIIWFKFIKIIEPLI